MEQVVFDDVIQVSVPDMYSFSAYKELISHGVGTKLST